MQKQQVEEAAAEAAAEEEEEAEDDEKEDWQIKTKMMEKKCQKLCKDFF